MFRQDWVRVLSILLVALSIQSICSYIMAKNGYYWNCRAMALSSTRQKLCKVWGSNQVESIILVLKSNRQTQ